METSHPKHPNYVGVFIALGLLTAIEVATSVYITGPARIPLLLLMAVAKGALVALYYMHLRFDSRIFSFFFGAAIFVLAIPFTLVLLAVSQGH